MMTETTEYEYRLSQALDRIAAHAEAAQRRAGADPAAVADLTAALDSQRQANQRLQTRIAALRDRQSAVMARLEARMAQMHDSLKRAGEEIARLTEANAALAQANRAVTGAEPGAAEAALSAEVAALRAAGTAQGALTQGLLGALDNLLAAAPEVSADKERDDA